MDVHTATKKFKLADSTIRVKTTGETGKYWGCDSVPPNFVTMVVQQGDGQTLLEFAVDEVEILE